MGRFRILSLDGGGIRGILTAIILERLNTERGIDGWLDSVGLIAGTSTGGILALGLAYGLDPNVIRSLYETKGKKIFDDSWIDNLVDIGKIIGADYDNRNLEKELIRVFGRARLRDLKHKVLIPAFDLDNESPQKTSRTWKPKLFQNYAGDGSDENELVYKVALYTSAAPTYFPAFDGYIDGGVYANNPSMCALAQSQDNRIITHADISELVLLSLGTGTSLFYIKDKSLDWGYAGWARPLINLMMDGVAGIADYQCRQILGQRYHRLAPVFDPDTSFPLDGVDKIPELINFANTRIDLDKTIEWISSYWQ